jgi:hypothetical protein
MPDQNNQQTTGVAVRGPDGQLYFIPAEKLAAFKVPEPAVATLNAKLPHGNIAAHASVSTDWMFHVMACMVAHDTPK